MGKYASKVVKQAQSWLGISESNGCHKEIIDTYNSHTPIARGYRMTLSDPWCATFVSAVSIKLGYTDIIPTECSCSRMIQLFKQLGTWVEDENRVPNPGDIIFYNWSDNGVGDNKDDVDHVGIVEKVNGNTIVVIEGNHDGSDADKIDGVERRNIAVNGRYIRGFAVPKYDKEVVVENKPTTNIVVTNNRIDTVVEVQKWLNNDYKFGLAEDNIYGKNTKTALVKVLQIGLGFTDRDVDGIYGPKTNAAIKNLKKGSNGEAVKALQGLLVCNGYAGAYVDGDFGNGTHNAVVDYQKKKGLGVDGIAGKATFSALCK